MVADFILTLLAMAAAFVGCAVVAGWIMDKYVIKKDTSDPIGSGLAMIVVCVIAGIAGAAAVVIF